MIDVVAPEGNHPNWFRYILQHGGGGAARAAQVWSFHRARGGGAAGGSKTRVLVLMSDTGGGHRASAQAIKAGFEQLYGDQYHFDIVDMWTQHTYFPFNRAAGSYSFMVTTWTLYHVLSVVTGIRHAQRHQVQLTVIILVCAPGEVSHPVAGGVHCDAATARPRAGTADHGPDGRPLCVAGLRTVQARPGCVCSPADAGDVFHQTVPAMRA